MKNIDIQISDLKAYENNAKKHSYEQIERVAESIEQFGFVQPIVVDKDNVIVIGHCRYEASKKLNLDKVPCIKIEELTDEQIKALRLIDNKLNESDWDCDLLNEEIEGINDIDLGLFGFEDICEYENINGENLENKKSILIKLTCGKINIMLSEDEYACLLERYNEYVNENQVSYGFIKEILNED